MDEPSLQSALREKYHIDEKLLAEGRFVVLIGDHAANLVSLGLGRTCIVIARLVLSGKEIDYDLLSLLPLPTVFLTCQDSNSKIKIHSQFRATQVFQQCTSDNQAEIWANFTSTIRKFYYPERGDIWTNPTLCLPPTIPEFKRSFISDLNHSKNSLHYFNSFWFYGTSNRSNCHTYSTISDSSVSLPTELPAHADNILPHYETNSRSLSLSFLDEIKFDSFVNDAPTRFSEYNKYYVPCSWNGSADDIVKLHNEELNKSNNSTEASNTADVKQQGKFMKFFSKILDCFRSDKKKE